MGVFSILISQTLHIILNVNHERKYYGELFGKVLKIRTKHATRPIDKSKEFRTAAVIHGLIFSTLAQKIVLLKIHPQFNIHRAMIISTSPKNFEKFLPDEKSKIMQKYD